MVRRGALLGLLGYGLGQFVVLAAFLSAESPLTRILINVIGDVFTVAVAAAGVVLMRRERAVAIPIVAGLAMLALGDETARRITGPDGSIAYPSIADLPYGLGTVLLLATFILVSLRAAGSRTRRSDSWLDTGLASAGLVVLAVQLGIVPALQAGDPVAVVVSLLYACTDVVGIVVAVRCLLAGKAATHGIWLLAAVCTLWYVTDLTYAVQELTGVYVSGGLLDLGWYLPNALLALTCWTGFGGTGRQRRRGGRHAPRMAIAALIGLAGPLGICVTVALDIPTSPIALAAGTVFPMALALTRMNRLLHTVEHQATHDSLTGLLNRAAFTEQAEDELSRRPGRTVLLIDLNGFKQVNDLYGHAAGDLVLARTALRLIRIAGPGGLVGRIGGDEFAVLLANGARAIDIPGIELALRSPVTRGERGGAPADEQLQVSASVGAASGDEPGGPSSVEQLLAAADVAMYTRKRTRDPAGPLTAPLPRRG